MHGLPCSCCQIANLYRCPIPRTTDEDRNEAKSDKDTIKWGGKQTKSRFKEAAAHEALAKEEEKEEQVTGV